jgi:hypothetical protein
MDAGQFSMDPGTLLLLIQQICQKLRRNYIFPEIAEKICANLENQFEGEVYKDINEAEFLAFALTTHLQEINHDRHLWLRWHPEPIPGAEDVLHQNVEWLADQKQKAQSENYGFRKIEILPGNIGYLVIERFQRLEWAKQRAVATLNYLAEVGALIIDLQHCEGGHPDMVTFFCSHFFSKEPVQLHSIYWRDVDQLQEYWTSPEIPGPRLERVPLFLLIGHDTFSAAESFASDLKTHQRATLIGDTTYGGAHPGTSFRVNSHFELFIPIGKALDPLTGQNWEGTGITPHITVPGEEALQVAHQLALETAIHDPHGPLPSNRA